MKLSKSKYSAIAGVAFPLTRASFCPFGEALSCPTAVHVFAPSIGWTEPTWEITVSIMPVDDKR